jgi:predicted MFS family arabinose efflux permease
MIELSLESGPTEVKGRSFWRNPPAWIFEKELGRNYWIFFSAAFFFDAGFAVYYFLFNLYMLDCGFQERQIGWIGGALALGSVAGTLPAGVLARRIGLKRVLTILFVVAPLLHAFRVFWVWEPAQICLGFLSGLVMSSWGVCFLPAIARLTTGSNRTSAFSFIFSVSIGTSMLGGIICGYLRRILLMAGISVQAIDVKRLILLTASAIVVLGLLPLLRLHLPADVPSERHRAKQPPKPRRRGLPTVSPFLMRFLVCMALWSALLAAFTPFANVYLARDLHVPMEQIGLIFSVVQMVQLCMGLLTPMVFRALGLVKGIALTQFAAAVLLWGMAAATNARFAVAFYLIFSAAQWMCSPGLYNLLMSETPDSERSSTAATTLFLNALASSGATAGAGLLFTSFGYPRVFSGLALVAVLCAGLVMLLMTQTCGENTITPSEPCST